MPKRIPIAAARRVAEAHDLKQVVLLGFDGELTHVVTWGATKADCEAAAKAQDFWKGAFAGVVRAAERYRVACTAHHEASMTRIIGDEASTSHAFTLADEEREAAAALLKAAISTGGGDGR